MMTRNRTLFSFLVAMMGIGLWLCTGCPSAGGGGEDEDVPECAAAGEACTAAADCCEGLICGEDGTCVAEEEPPECAAEGEACTANEDCCEGLICGEDGTCAVEEEPPECAAEGEACTAAEDCCEGLICGEDGTCMTEEEPGADGEALYTANCACHGADGTGPPDVTGFDAAALATGLESGTHAAITLTEDEVAAIAVFLGG